MSLREQLREILPQILPSDPSEAIKGTELIRLVRFRLGDDYSDATLRYHFSILSYDPTSPIAKVDQGQGYYFRIGREPGNPESNPALFEEQQEAGDLERTRHGRFRSIVERHCLHGSRFPLVISQEKGGNWEVPDMVITDWDFDEDKDEGLRLDEELMRLKSHLGMPVATLTAAQLKLDVTLASCNADFFQALSASRWANQGEVLIAQSVSDAALVETLRNLGHQYGLGITSFGVDLTLLDELPGAEQIRRMSAAEFESLQTLLKFQRISVATPRAHLDWNHLAQLKKKHSGIRHLMGWLNTTLTTRMPEWDRETTRTAPGGSVESSETSE